MLRCVVVFFFRLRLVVVVVVAVAVVVLALCEFFSFPFCKAGIRVLHHVRGEGTGTGTGTRFHFHFRETLFCKLIICLPAFYLGIFKRFNLTGSKLPVNPLPTAFRVE